MESFMSIRLDFLNEKLLYLLRSSDNFISIGNAMIQIGIEIADLEDQFREGILHGQTQASIEKAAQKLYLDELTGQLLYISESMDHLFGRISITDWYDSDIYWKKENEHR